MSTVHITADYAEAYEKYNKLYGSAKSCTISLIDCSKLDALASICKNIHMNGIKITNDYDIQKYKRTEPYLVYDFGQYTKRETAQIIWERKCRVPQTSFMNIFVIHLTDRYIPKRECSALK